MIHIKSVDVNMKIVVHKGGRRFQNDLKLDIGLNLRFKSLFLSQSPLYL